MKQRLPEPLLLAVADIVHDERQARTTADRDLAADLARQRERIDEYGNVIATKFALLTHQMRDLVDDAVAALDVKDGAQGPPGEAGPVGPPGERGEAGPVGPPGADAYPGQARGIHVADGVYRAMDLVTCNGCEWRAVRDDPGPLPGDGWVLGAKQGKRGDRGDRGPPGPQGPAAAGVDAVLLREWSLVLVFSDGTDLTCDLFPLFDRYHRQAA